MNHVAQDRSTDPPIHIRDLETIEEFRRVVELEHEIWGFTDAADTVTLPVLIITTRRGGILLGAFDAQERMVGFTFSLPGLRHGRPMQWSHMLGVLGAHRASGLGRRLKLEQRARALGVGLDLIEWTFDPLQAANAHLNFAKLGVVSDEYARNFYGESTSALHRGTPTDRLVVQWHLEEPHVVRRVERPAGLTMRAADIATVPAANEVLDQAGQPRCVATRLDHATPRVWLEIPAGFTELQQRAPECAREWRFRTRELFEAYFAQGYRAVDFILDKARGGGRYLLAKSE